MIVAQAMETGKSKRAMWKKLCSTECICNNARQITMAIWTNSGRQGLSQVWGPQPNNPLARPESTSKSELEITCLEEAGRWFTQASHMPFLQTPLVELFMESNVYTPAFEQVLQGTFQCPPGTDQMAKRLIEALVQPTNIPQISWRTLDEITAGSQKAREETSSSPSTLVTTWQAPSIPLLRYLMHNWLMWDSQLDTLSNAGKQDWT